MLELFEANRTGFNQKLEVGETIEYKDKNYIIIGIYNTRINRIGDPRITSDLVCQSVNYSPDLTSRYKKYVLLEYRHKITDENSVNNTRNIFKIGTVIPYSNNEEKIFYQIYGIEKFEYEHVDLLVTYQMRLIEPWSQAEIDKAVKLNRLSKFNVLGNAF
ncbi:TPA: hypothetical protein ACGU7O_001154 [Enterococcus faecium]|uniref:hypothetical protein n=1 Tax=Enterococcus TaxID=1350 RepID=UPI000F6601C0|nr:hypothetical protein [Enterococcus faecium]EKQ3345328.1 hypothetical protein [Enterococcus faecium]EKQ3703122.1 hypothetical protein [Enterococcus faecium]MBG7860903.1 hypothetical protein [Enterococcus faecium]MBG8110196.1 hypothetical protein [Enterococcus faecium]MBG8295372.1 hypothetical protein [Enterococcus faecium]